MRGNRLEALGPGHASLRDTTREMKILNEARRSVAVHLLNHDYSPEAVQIAAGVPWKVLASWCYGNDGELLVAAIVAEAIQREAEEVSRRYEATRLRQAASRGERSDDGDVLYRHKLEELEELKREYEGREGVGCEPFTMRSSDEIDALQGLVDHWFG